MIEPHPIDFADDSASCIVLRPNRALTVLQWVGVFAGLAAVSMVVAIYSFMQGNVFAPLFALAHMAFVAFALRWAWRGGERYEVVAVDSRSVTVRRSAQPGLAFEAAPHWVRVALEGKDEDVRVVLGSSGRRIVLGSFLAPEERRRLASRLKDMLDAVEGAGPEDSQQFGLDGVNP